MCAFVAKHLLVPDFGEASSFFHKSRISEHYETKPLIKGFRIITNVQLQVKKNQLIGRIAGTVSADKVDKSQVGKKDTPVIL